MTNPVKIDASLPPDELLLIMSTWDEVWAGFKPYLKNPLGTSVHIHKFSNGSEAKIFATRYRLMVFMRVQPCTPAPQVRGDGLAKLKREVSAWTDEVFDTEAKAAGINLSKSRTLTSLGGGTVLYEPTDVLTNELWEPQ